MPLDPRSDACVQPAPKSRFVVSGLLRSKIKIKIKIHRNGNGNGNGAGNGNCERRTANQMPLFVSICDRLQPSASTRAGNRLS
jgi:hypothetical protein